MRVLIIEDSQQVMETVVDYLELDGIECDCAYDGRQALALVSQSRFDVIIADIMMARMDGVSTVREMRESLRIGTPVIFLTARDSLSDKQAAFEAGGDDYLVKPFAMQELMLRVRALARRALPVCSRRYEFAGLCCDSETGEVTWQQTPLRLARLQRLILERLLKEAPLMVCREALIDAVWCERTPASDALRSHVYALRNALKRADVTVILETVHGEGYRLVRNDR